MSPPVPEDVLREALDADPLQGVVSDLPTEEACDRGLCVDTSPADSIQVEGKTRLSLLRVYSKAHGTRKLVGQVQILAGSRDRSDWSLEYYTHDLQFPNTEEHPDRDRWRDAMEDLHTRLTGLRS